MLEDIKFDLQTLDYRAINASQWSELKSRLERCARYERNQAIAVHVAHARHRLSRFASNVKARFSSSAERIGRALARKWEAHVIAQQRRNAVSQLNALGDLDLKDMGLRRCEIYSAVYRQDPSRLG
jgi:uncharacterized protein YjiS (DUF1127 family)